VEKDSDDEDDEDEDEEDIENGGKWSYILKIKNSIHYFSEENEEEDEEDEYEEVFSFRINSI
jgi:hypothetical protein